jgi:hypothetical protein
LPFKGLLKDSNDQRKYSTISAFISFMND